MKKLIETTMAVTGRFFYRRPALKRGMLALALYGVPVLTAAILPFPGVILTIGAAWALALFMLFLGMGAERAALDWGPVFALPPLKSFAFWRWHALEKKRFLAVLLALATGLASTVLPGILP